MEELLLKKYYPLEYGSNNHILRTVSSPIAIITPAIASFAKDLLELMWIYDGVWLAAPQVGKNIRMFAYSQRDYTKKKTKFLSEWIMINPEIIASSDVFLSDTEACLSLPGEKWNVKRPEWVVMKYSDVRWQKKVLKAEWYNARILLHELDHLDAVLFIDKLS